MWLITESCGISPSSVALRAPASPQGEAFVLCLPLEGKVPRPVGPSEASGADEVSVIPQENVKNLLCVDTIQGTWYTIQGATNHDEPYRQEITVMPETEMSTPEALKRSLEVSANRFNLKCLAVLCGFTVLCAICNRIGDAFRSGNNQDIEGNSRIRIAALRARR